jgi:hypothetical protein
MSLTPSSATDLLPKRLGAEAGTQEPRGEPAPPQPWLSESGSVSARPALSGLPHTGRAPEQHRRRARGPLRCVGGYGYMFAQPGNLILAVLNFAPVARHNYRVGAPRDGFWKELLNSDAKDYGGSGLGKSGRDARGRHSVASPPVVAPFDPASAGSSVFHQSPRRRGGRRNETSLSKERGVTL